MTNANIEYEILAAASTLWNTGVNGDTYKCYLSEGDFDRLLAEFNEPLKVLIFTRFAVEVQDARAATSFVSGDAHWTYLSPRQIEQMATKTNVRPEADRISALPTFGAAIRIRGPSTGLT